MDRGLGDGHGARRRPRGPRAPREAAPQVFTDLDGTLGRRVGAMELAVLRNKEGLRGDHEVARSILRPGLHKRPPARDA